MLLLLGNRKLNTSIDTLVSPILLRGYCCMATNNRMDGVSNGPAWLYREDKAQQRSDQFSAGSGLKQTSQLVVNHKGSQSLLEASIYKSSSRQLRENIRCVLVVSQLVDQFQ
jgi:hypothetical protein